MKNSHPNSNRKKTTIAILYHLIPQESSGEYYSKQNALVDIDTEETVKLVKEILINNGYITQLIQLKSNSLEELTSINAKYIFNLVDSKKLELRIAKILDRMKLPYSGSDFKALLTSNNKIRSKSLFEKFNIPTPPYLVIAPGEKILRSNLPSKFPMIVKPAFEHASVGINTHSVVTTFQQLKNKVKAIRNQLKQTVICEKFIRGEEFQVTVLETESKTEALPIAEMVVKGMNNNVWNIYGFREKWDKKSRIYKNLHFISPAKSVPDKIARLIQRDAIRAFYALGFRDYARFDVRYNKSTKRWFFLEGNGNPGICNAWDDAMTASINASGIKLEDFLMGIIHNRLN